MPSRVTFRLEDVCFVHWPVAPDSVSPELPEGWEPTLHDGSAWLSVFGSKIRPRDLPERQRYGQLSVRTYVQPEGGDDHMAAEPLVFVLDMVVDSAFAAAGAATLFGYPTRNGRVSIGRTTDGVTVTYSRLLGDGFDVTLTPAGTPETPASGSLANWLVNRDDYVRTDGEVDHVDHEPWLIQAASGTVDDDSWVRSVVEPTGQPLFHYSPGVILRV